MQFLKTLFWVVLAVALVIFANANWSNVTVNLWGGLQADVKLPVLVIAAFLLGFVPMLILYRTRVWSLRKRLEGQDRVTVYNRPASPVTSSPEPVVRPPAAGTTA